MVASLALMLSLRSRFSKSRSVKAEKFLPLGSSSVTTGSGDGGLGIGGGSVLKGGGGSSESIISSSSPGGNGTFEVPGCNTVSGLSSETFCKDLRDFGAGEGGSIFSESTTMGLVGFFDAGNQEKYVSSLSCFESLRYLRRGSSAMVRPHAHLMFSLFPCLENPFLVNRPVFKHPGQVTWFSGLET